MHADERDIRELIARWMEATKAGDHASVLDLMSDDVVFMVPGQAPFGKTEFEAATRQQQAMAMRFDGHSEVLEVQLLGDWAFARTRLRVEVRIGDAPKTNARSGHTLSIFRRDLGRWRLVRDANLLAPE
ncbi:YybH family protein [Arenimonas sp.]|uniref:YybH family protein n=1 Tax=Arenimonas sp. TaxID=1872635 RepID=UPI0039E6D253